MSESEDIREQEGCDDDSLSADLQDLVDLWRPRNDFIMGTAGSNARSGIRAMLSGMNEIELPDAKGYTPRAMHTFSMLATINQQHGRFGRFPNLTIVSEEGKTAENQAASTEKGIRGIFERIEARDKTRFWSRAVLDMVALDEGWILLERAPAQFWPLLVPDDDSKDALQKEIAAKPYQFPGGYENASEQYKRAAGPPFRGTSIRLENVYPKMLSSQPVGVFHVEVRSLARVLENPIFDTEVLEGYTSRKGAVSERSQVTLVRYCNASHYGYYALCNLSQTGAGYGISFPDVSAQGGNLLHLYSYKHDTGRPIYSRLPGRFGGWQGEYNDIQMFANALAELNQKQDELASQAFTNVRSRYWPTTYTVINPVHRPRVKGQEPSVQIEEGGNFILYPEEEIHLLFEAEDDPMFQFLWSKNERAMDMLTGGPTVFGGQPDGGSDSGYQHDLELTTGEGLAEMVAQGAADGAIDLAELLCAHIVAMGEPIPVVVKTAKDNRTISLPITIKPSDVSPTPVFDAQGAQPKDTNLVAAADIYQRLTASPAPGVPAAMTRRTAREKILGLTDPNSEERKWRMQESEDAAYMAGVLQQEVLKQFNLLVAAGPQRPVSPEDAKNADPALSRAVNTIANSGETEQVGGVSANVMNAAAEGGMPPGQAQPAQQVGLAASREEVTMR